MAGTNKAAEKAVQEPTEAKAEAKVYNLRSSNKYLTVSSLGVQFMAGKEMEEYLQTQSFNESRVEFLNQHLTKVTVNKDSFLLEFDLIGGAILTGKDFYLFVDNPRRDCQGSEGAFGCPGSVVHHCDLRKQSGKRHPLSAYLECGQNRENVLSSGCYL